MSAAPSTTKRNPPSALKLWSLRILFFALGLLGIGLVGAWFTVAFGGVAGVELCPQTFERRAFTYYEIPLTGWQVSKVTRTNRTGDMEEYLVNQKLLPKKPKGETIWHIVTATRGRRSWTGDAQILTNYIDAEDSSGDSIWLKWTQANPKLAGVLWPAISQLAIDELYIYVPEVLALAEGTEDAKDQAGFSPQLNKRLGQAYHAAALRCQQADNHEAAVHYLDQALRYEPGKAEYVAARSKSSEALKGQSKSNP